MRSAFLAMLVKKAMDGVNEMAKALLLMAEEDDVTEKVISSMFGDIIDLERLLQI